MTDKEVAAKMSDEELEKTIARCNELAAKHQDDMTNAQMALHKAVVLRNVFSSELNKRKNP